MQLSVSCEQQDGISLTHCNANQSATTIQYIEILGAIRIEKNKEKEGHAFEISSLSKIILDLTDWCINKKYKYVCPF